MTAQGFADLHCHQFANLGFGGVEFFGGADGDLPTAVPWCTPAHGPGGTGDVVGWVVKLAYQGLKTGLGHKVGGYPQFDGWPRYDSVTHQSVHVDWLQRAWQGGLRLMVMHAVNNEWMCTLPGFKMAPGRTGNDMEAVDLQFGAARAVEAMIDQESGGPGQGWYRIVDNCVDAQATIEAGKLAVVLGIEVDHLFGSYLTATLTDADVAAAVQKYYDLGVRHVFPIHFADNLFGGTAFQNGLQADGIALTVGTPFGSFSTPYALQTEDGKSLGYEYRGGRQNVRGLTDLGRVLISELIKRGMLFDVDHMSYKCRSSVLDIAEANNYPVISGHSGYIDVCRGDKRHEGQLTGIEVDRIRQLGGMVAPITAQGSLSEIATWTRPDGTSIPHVCGFTLNTFVQPYLYAVARMQGGSVAFGTDFNGFAGVPGPLTGPDACPGGATGNIHLSLMTYPFEAGATGVTMDRSEIGKKSYDIANDGLAHIGMLPDMVACLASMGVRAEELRPALESAASYAELWRKAAQQRDNGIAASVAQLLLLG